MLHICLIARPNPVLGYPSPPEARASSWGQFPKVGNKSLLTTGSGWCECRGVLVDIQAATIELSFRTCSSVLVLIPPGMRQGPIALDVTPECNLNRTAHDSSGAFLLAPSLDCRFNPALALSHEQWQGGSVGSPSPGFNPLEAISELLCGERPNRSSPQGQEAAARVALLGHSPMNCVRTGKAVTARKLPETPGQWGEESSSGHRWVRNTRPRTA